MAALRALQKLQTLPCHPRCSQQCRRPEATRPSHLRCRNRQSLPGREASCQACQGRPGHRQLARRGQRAEREAQAPSVAASWTRCQSDRRTYPPAGRQARPRPLSAAAQLRQQVLLAAAPLPGAPEQVLAGLPVQRRPQTGLQPVRLVRVPTKSQTGQLQALPLAAWAPRPKHRPARPAGPEGRLLLRVLQLREQPLARQTRPTMAAAAPAAAELAALRQQALQRGRRLRLRGRALQGQAPAHPARPADRCQRGRLPLLELQRQRQQCGALAAPAS